jgi:hypothetical protein
MKRHLFASPAARAVDSYSTKKICATASLAKKSHIHYLEETMQFLAYATCKQKYERDSNDASTATSLQ